MPANCTPKTQIYRDIGLSGDDVDDYLAGIEKRFGFDMKDFKVWKYFPDERT